jgi:hypothetical protein
MFASCLLCTSFPFFPTVFESPTTIMFLTNFSLTTLQSLGVLAEAQYFQNVMRTGFRLRSTLVRVCNFITFQLDFRGYVVNRQ